MKKVPFALALVACSAPRPFEIDAGRAPEPRVTCVTIATCSLACDDASTWTTTSCAEDVAKSACVDSRDEGTAYGCAFSCDRSAQVTEGACSELP